MKKLFSVISNLQTYYRFKLDFQKVGQYTGGRWLIHGTKHRKDNPWNRYEWHRVHIVITKYLKRVDKFDALKYPKEMQNDKKIK